MAWTATVKQKSVQDGAFLVNVSYSNGVQVFNEVLDMTGGTIDVFNAKIASRLNTLETTQATAVAIVTGVFTPTTPTPSALEAFLVKLRVLRSAQNAVDLGLITKLDTSYTQALADAKALFDPSFIGQF